MNFLAMSLSTIAISMATIFCNNVNLTEEQLKSLNNQFKVISIQECDLNIGKQTTKVEKETPKKDKEKLQDKKQEDKTNKKKKKTNKKKQDKNKQDKTEDKKQEQNNNDFARQVLDLVNKERAKEKLSKLSTTSLLGEAADKRAKEIVNTFSHTRPNGSSWSTVLKELKISYKAAGENIAYGQGTPQEVVKAWMNSPGHRANILNANFGKLGVGVYKDSKGIIYWTQIFTN